MKWIIVLMCASAFLGGYILGQQGDSVDVFSWAEKSYKDLFQQGTQLAPNIADNTPILAPKSEPPRQAIVEIAGKLYRIGTEKAADYRSR